MRVLIYRCGVSERGEVCLSKESVYLAVGGFKRLVYAVFVRLCVLGGRLARLVCRGGRRLDTPPRDVCALTIISFCFFRCVFCNFAECFYFLYEGGEGWRGF